MKTQVTYKGIKTPTRIYGVNDDQQHFEIQLDDKELDNIDYHCQQVLKKIGATNSATIKFKNLETKYYLSYSHYRKVSKVTKWRDGNGKIVDDYVVNKISEQLTADARIRYELAKVMPIIEKRRALISELSSQLFLMEQAIANKDFSSFESHDYHFKSICSKVRGY